jgi:geranylgeranyl diphosphate synthase, type II
VSVEPAGGVADMLANLLGAALLGARGRTRLGASRAGAPDVIDLGAVAPGGNAAATLWLHNTGPAPIGPVAVAARLAGGPDARLPRLVTTPTVVPALAPGDPGAVEVLVKTEPATPEGDFVWELSSEGTSSVVRVLVSVTEPGTDRPTATAFGARLRVYASMVRRAMLEQLPTGEPESYLYQPVREYPRRVGKHMRAAICLSTCEALGGDTDQALAIAAPLELLHNALLIHDDIQDGSSLRRGEVTLHERHGVPLALNAGDALAMFAVERLHEAVLVGDSVLASRLRDEFGQAVRRTVEGQALELGWQRDGVVDLRPEDYLDMAVLKTCAYTTVLPLRAGALLARAASIDLDALTALAIPLGLAFQIRDDLLSLQPAGAGGKDALGDLYEGKRSLAIIHLLATSSGPDRSFLRRFLKGSRAERTPAAVAQVWELLERHGSLALASAHARQFAIEARARFDKAFASTQPSPALNFLCDMIDYMVDRQS